MCTQTGSQGCSAFKPRAVSVISEEQLAIITPMPLSFWYYLTTTVEIRKTVSGSCLPFSATTILQQLYKPICIESHFEAQYLSYG